MSMPSHEEFFDRAAPTWDEQIRVDPRRIETILSYASVSPGDHILDVGCGTGILFPYLLEKAGPQGRVYALDISAEMLSRAREKYGGDDRVRFLHGSVQGIPLPDAACQVVVCFSAFPHFPDKKAAVAEMARVLADSGRLLVAHAEGRGKINLLHASIGGAVAHDRLPDPATMRWFLQEAGLEELIFIDKEDLYVLLASKKQR